MSEIYWITRLSCIRNVFIPIMVVFLILSIVFIIGYIVNNIDESTSKEGGPLQKEAKKLKNMFRSFAKWSVSIAIFSMLVVVFVPTTKEALLIYGVGGTIDYIQDNTTARKLPDKCIKALDKYLDELTGDNKKKSNQIKELKEK